MPSKVPALLDYLVALFQNAPALGQASPPVKVYDGPPTTGEDPPLKLYVGLTDPGNEAIDAAATWTQSRDDMGSMTRLEQTDIHCCAEAWSGTDGISVVRHSVAAILAAVETLVRSNTDQFGGAAQLAAPGLSAGVLMQNNTSAGAIARIPFSLSFKSFT